MLSLEDSREEAQKGLGRGRSHNQSCIFEESPRKEYRKRRGQVFKRRNKVGGQSSNLGIQMWPE